MGCLPLPARGSTARLRRTGHRVLRFWGRSRVASDRGPLRSSPQHFEPGRPGVMASTSPIRRRYPPRRGRLSSSRGVELATVVPSPARAEQRQQQTEDPDARQRQRGNGRDCGFDRFIRPVVVAAGGAPDLRREAGCERASVLRAYGACFSTGRGRRERHRYRVVRGRVDPDFPMVEPTVLAAYPGLRTSAYAEQFPDVRLRALH